MPPVSGAITFAAARVVDPRAATVSARTDVHVRDGRMRALAVTGPQRLAALPDYPTLIEAGLAGVEVENWYALLAPAGTPADRLARIHAVLSAALSRPDTLRSYVDQGQRVLNLDPERSTAFIRAEIAKWAEVVRAAGMRAE